MRPDVIVSLDSINMLLNMRRGVVIIMMLGILDEFARKSNEFCT